MCVSTLTIVEFFTINDVNKPCCVNKINNLSIVRASRGGGGGSSYIHVLPHEFLLNRLEFNRNSSDRI